MGGLGLDCASPLPELLGEIVHEAKSRANFRNHVASSPYEEVFDQWPSDPDCGIKDKL